MKEQNTEGGVDGRPLTDAKTPTSNRGLESGERAGESPLKKRQSPSCYFPIDRGIGILLL